MKTNFLLSKGDTSKVIDFMLENSIHTDDLKSIEGLTSKNRLEKKWLYTDDLKNIEGLTNV